MNTTAATPPQSEHPSPLRKRVSGAAIGFGLCAAPLAWSLQVVVNASSAGHACNPINTALSMPQWPFLHLVVLSIDVAALAICLIAGLVAWNSWRKSSDEKPGSGHHLLATGDGRTRFMAMAGMLTSGLFFIAVSFATLNLLAVTGCGR